MEKDLDKILEEISELRPMDQLPKIEETASLFNRDVSVINAELKQFENKQKLELKLQKEKDKITEKERKVELKKLSEAKKKETKAEEDRVKEEAKQQAEDEKNLQKQETKSKMDGDFSFKIVTLLATKQENEATELCSRKAQEKHKFYSTKNDIKSELWVYDGEGVTQPNGKTLIEFLCRKWMGEAYESRWVKIVISKVKADNQINEDIFFNEQSKHKEEIPVKNGILNIYTRVLSPFTSTKIFFNKLPVTYNKEAKCPAIKKFFGEVLAKEDDTKVMYELIGFSLLKEYRYEKAFMFLGDGRNGKGKTINLIKHFLGSQNYSSVPLDQFNTSSSGIHEMFGKLINLAGDISPTALKDTGLMKQLCGRDNINAKRKYLRDLSFENYAKLVFAANELPRVYDFSLGFWSRWILLEFPYTFVSQTEYNKRGCQNE